MFSRFSCRLEVSLDEKHKSRSDGGAPNKKQNADAGYPTDGLHKQTGGGYQAAGSLEALEDGSKIIIAGLFVQLFCFGCFIVISVAFHLAINKQPTGRSASDIPWRKHLKALYLGSALIMVRSIFRAVEYLQGFNGYLLSHEVYLYVFDALLMIFVMIWFNWVHPAEILSPVRGNQWHGDIDEDCYGMRMS